MNRTIAHPSIFTILSLALAPFAATSPGHAALLKEAQVTRIVNDVDLIESSDSRRDAKTNDIMRDDMVLATGHKSRAELRFTDETLARIGANSFFTFTEGTRNMELGKGTMLLKVPKGAGGAKVSTQSVTAAITGTTVLLETNPGGPVVLNSGDPIPTPEADADLRAQGLGQYVNPSIYKSAGRPVPKEKTMWAANMPAPNQSMRVSAVTGSVRVMHPGETESIPVQAGDSIPVGSYVFTQNNSSAILNPVEGVASRITPGSTVRVKALDVRVNVKPKVEFELKEGSILSALGPEDARKIDYQIKTAQGVVAARGTVNGASVIDGRTAVFGGHGTTTFSFGGREEVITPGKFKNFINQGGNIQVGTDLPTDSPQFQAMMQQTMQLVQLAAERGLIRPSMPSEVRSALQSAGVQVPQTTPQPSGTNAVGAESSENNNGNTPAPQPIARRNNPSAQGGLNVGGENKKGFSKLIVLEGKMRVYLNDRLGESMIIEPGQMIILNPNANRLPRPVNVDLNRLTQTSGLVNGFKEPTPSDDGVTVEQDGSGNTILKDPQVLEALADQKKKLDNGDLQPTGLGITKNKLFVERQEKPNIEVRSSVQNSDNPVIFDRPTINQGSVTLDSQARILGAPPQLEAGGQTYSGSIYRTASNQAIGDFAFFNGVNAVDQALSQNNGGPANPLGEDAAIFKFENLNIVGNPDLTRGSVSTLFGSIQPEALGLIGFNNVNMSGLYGGNDEGLGSPDTVFIVSENGGLNLGVPGAITRFNNFGNNVIFYARNGDLNAENLLITNSQEGEFSLSSAKTIHIDNTNADSIAIIPPPKHIDVNQMNIQALGSIDISGTRIAAADFTAEAKQGITIQNSSDINALMLVLRNTGSGNITIDNTSPLDAGTSGSIDLQNSGGNIEIGNIAGGASLMANRITAQALGNNGTVKIYANSNLSATQQINLFANSGNGTIWFANPAATTNTINLNAGAGTINIDAHTVRIDDLLSVNNTASNTNITATVREYNSANYTEIEPGNFGNFTNNTNQN